MTIARFSQDDQDMLDGKGRASPFGVPALRLLIGTLFNTIIDALNTGAFAPDLADDSAGKGASLVAIESGSLTTLTATDVQELAEQVDVLPAVAGDAHVIPTLTAATEASNHIDVTVALNDANGDPVAEVRRCRCQAFDANMLASVVGAITLAEVGAGSEVSTTAKPGLVIDTDANGAATVRIVDVAGTLAADIWLWIEPVNKPGSAALIKVTFA